jgi:metallo-beta-lactamase family protein
MHLTFLGAAGTVTGSRHLLEVDGRRILVDCGLFQGLKELRLRNWEPLPVDPGSIDVVVLTHAHLDHCGYLPRLVAGGFAGRVFCTPATKELCSLVLPDAAHIQEEDARDANRGGFTKHAPALPLFTTIDAARALDRLQPVGYDRPVPLLPGSGPGPTVEFLNAGHLLGSAYARVRVGDRTLLFGGDLGRYGRPVLPDPSPVAEADILLVETTYGDRLHNPDDNGDAIAAIVTDTAARGGKLIIPSFAIGRVEEVLYWLKRLEDEKRIPVLPVYVDSPMAIGALRFYTSRLAELDAEIANPELRHQNSDTGTPTPELRHQNSDTGTPTPELRHRTSDTDDGDAASGGVCDAAVYGGRLAAAVGGNRQLAAAVHCHRLERNGDRRARAAASRRHHHQPEKHGPVRWLSGRRHPRPSPG